MKSPKQFKRYVPTLIKIELDKLTYERKDDLYVIIDLIHRKEIYYKSEYQDRYGFTEISLAQFKELIPSCVNLNKGIQFLVDSNLLLRNNYFVMGIKPKSYKIPKEFLSKPIGVTITDKNINKRINNQIKEHKKMKVKNLDFAQTHYYKTFKVNIDGASIAILDRTIAEIRKLCFNLNIDMSDGDIRDIIECANGHEKKRFLILVHEEGKELDNIIHRYMIYTTRINAINDGLLFFKRNSTNGRLDTNLTSLPSFLRPYLISKEKLINLDIKNSQPYFLYTLIKNNSDINNDELSRFGELVVEGKLYEYLADQYKDLTGYDRTREQMKKMLYKIFFSKRDSFKHQKQFFGGVFTTIMEYINKTNERQHNTLAIQLQSKESFTVLDIIMPLLEKHSIRPYTIHDSFVCLETEAVLIKKLFIDKLTELYGIAPALHMNYLLPHEVNEADDDYENVEPWDDEFLELLNPIDKENL